MQQDTDYIALFNASADHKFGLHIFFYYRILSYELLKDLCCSKLESMHSIQYSNVKQEYIIINESVLG